MKVRQTGYRRGKEKKVRCVVLRLTESELKDLKDKSYKYAGGNISDFLRIIIDHATSEKFN